MHRYKSAVDTHRCTGRNRWHRLQISLRSVYTEFGLKPNRNGIKTMMLEVKRRLDEGEDPMDVAQDPEYFDIVRQSTCFFRKYQGQRQAKTARTDQTMPKVYVKYSDSGTGKTTWLDEQFGLDGWTCAPTNTG